MLACYRSLVLDEPCLECVLLQSCYVNYNLRLRLEEVSGPLMREEGDFIDQLAHLSFYDEKNLVREWI